MGRYFFRLPDVGEGVAEAEIVEWHIAAGDVIVEDQNMVDVMTDKATVEMSSPVDGKVVSVRGAAGDIVPVGSVLVELDVEGADEAPEARSAADDQEEGASQAQPAPSAEPAFAEPAPSAGDPPPPARPAPRVTDAGPPLQHAAFATRAAGDAPLASPATRRRAQELGIDLRYVAGSGPAGRITADDLDIFIASGGSHTAAGAGSRVKRSGIAETRIIGLRRKIAEKMQEAKRRIPHITYVEEIDVTELESLRIDLNVNHHEDQPKLTMLPFLMQALVRALPDFPQINARYDDDMGILHSYEGTHIGIATQTPAGLMVPVVSHAEARDIWDMAREVARLSAAARDGTAQREELSGSSITVTSLGPLGGVNTTPVINHPEVAIIGPNKIVERPIVDGSFITVRKIMNLSSSFDHRIVDGYDAALFVQQLKRLLEHPALLFMD